MNILTLSDKLVESIYTPSIVDRFEDVDLILGCGDLPYYYLEFVQDILRAPLYFVHGNHDSKVEYGSAGEKTAPGGATNLHRRVANYKSLLMAGLEGSQRYKRGPFMYSQSEMWFNVLTLVPKLLTNRIMNGRYLDILISHAPPWGIHDQHDVTHQGFKALRWLISVFKPAYHFHGHIHLYSSNTKDETQFVQTRVINTYGYRETKIKAISNDHRRNSGDNN